MSELNRDFQGRDRLLFGQTISWKKEGGGNRHFRGVSVATLKQLVAHNYADPDGSQNLSPTLGQFIAFLEEFPYVEAHGYAVSPLREDYRVTVEGLEYSAPVSQQLRRKFEEMNGRADELICSDERLFCWYD
jgi:hypothetical protein